jgi:hypothetical protein
MSPAIGLDFSAVMVAVLRVKACPTLSVLATMASVHHFLLWHR